MQDPHSSGGGAGPSWTEIGPSRARMSVSITAMGGLSNLAAVIASPEHRSPVDGAGAHQTLILSQTDLPYGGSRTTPQSEASDATIRNPRPCSSPRSADIAGSSGESS